MKIFNKENGKEVVYVQKGELAYLMHSCESIPTAIISDFFSEVVIIDGNNKDEFVRFENPSEIKFFKNEDWIVDYHDLVNLSEDQIIEEGKKAVVKMNEIAVEYNDTEDNELRRKLHNKYDLYEYKFYNIRDFLWVRQGHINYDFPLVPDSNGFKFNGNDDEPYTIVSSLDPNKLLLYRKDGEPLKEDEQIPLSFINMGLSIATVERQEKDSFYFGDYSTNRYLSNDNKYLVIEYKVDQLNKDKEYKENNKTETKEKGLRKALKKIFGKSH